MLRRSGRSRSNAAAWQSSRTLNVQRAPCQAAPTSARVWGSNQSLGQVNPPAAKLTVLSKLPTLEEDATQTL